MGTPLSAPGLRSKLYVMEWLTLVNWVLVAALALPAAGVQLPSLGGQALCALGGLAAIVVFASGGAAAFAWIAVALACVGTILAAVGGRTLIEDAAGTLQTGKQSRTEMVAGLVGLELPFFATAGVLSLAVAVIA
jgi:hypothetical protein